MPPANACSGPRCGSGTVAPIFRQGNAPPDSGAQRGIIWGTKRGKCRGENGRGRNLVRAHNLLRKPAGPTRHQRVNPKARDGGIPSPDKNACFVRGPLRFEGAITGLGGWARRAGRRCICVPVSVENPGGAGQRGYSLPRPFGVRVYRGGRGVNLACQDSRESRAGPKAVGITWAAGPTGPSTRAKLPTIPPTSPICVKARTPLGRESPFSRGSMPVPVPLPGQSQTSLLKARERAHSFLLLLIHSVPGSLQGHRAVVRWTIAGYYRFCRIPPTRPRDLPFSSPHRGSRSPTP